MTSQTGRIESGVPGSKGLKGGALGFVSTVVIGVASTAPAYSLAVTLGLVAGAVGILSPLVVLIAFVPMLFIAIAYYYLNRADPDCGTSFSWVTKAMGPWAGWMTGWAIIVADIVVMASLAEIASMYTYSLLGIDTTTFDSPWSTVAVVALGVLFIAVLTWICYVGIEVSARTQIVLLGTELFALAVFAIVALVRVYGGGIADSVTPSLSWFDPAGMDSGALATGMLLVLFIYWGWDTSATVNEETKNATETPGRAAVLATVMLVVTYILVTAAAQAFHGAAFLAAQGSGDVLGTLANDVLGSPLDKLVILAVLTSAAASTQTTILPTARTALSMGAKRALPAYWARTHERYLTPSSATLWMGVLSVVWYVGLKIVSENVFYDAVLALGLMIAFYYGLTGYACAIYYRHRLVHSLKDFVMLGLLPVTGGVILTWAFVRSVIDLADPANSTAGDSWFGLGPPLVITIAFAIVGVVLMVVQAVREPAFFRRPLETSDEPQRIGRPIAGHGAAHT
jgi:amino acid transporter